MEKETKVLLGIIALVVAGLIGVFMLFNKPGDAATTSTESLVRADSQKQGSGSVNLVEFGDYQCPSCAAAHPIVQRLMKEYEGKITFVFRNYPLESIHKNALLAAKYAEASAKQNKFWQMHDKLYEAQKEWSELGDPAAKFADYATALGMDAAKLKNDANEAAILTLIKRDQTDGDAAGVQGTPSFFIDGKAVAKSDYDSLKTAIDTAIAQK
jgi:protein-disulfide isomerase